MFSNYSGKQHDVDINISSYDELMLIINNLDTIHRELSRETRISLTTQLVDYILEYVTVQHDCYDHIQKLFDYDYLIFYGDENPFLVFNKILSSRLNENERNRILNKLKLLHGDPYND